MTLHKNKLTKSGLALTDLGLGGASLTGMHTPVAPEDADATIKDAMAAGIDYVDTAPFYGHGLSEHRVGMALRGHDPVISTKVGRMLRPGKAPPSAWVDALPFTHVFDYSYDAVMRSFEDSLQRLGRDHVDILYMHDIGDLTHGEDEGAAHFRTAMEGGYRALDQLRREGTISAIGLGVNEVAVCRAALKEGDWDAFLLAGRYTLLEQAPLDDLFPEAAAAGTDIIIGGPFNSGVLVGGDTFDYGAVPEKVARHAGAIKEVCTQHGVELPAAALAFCRAHPIVKSTIPGPRTPDELAQIIAWWGANIPDAFWEDLKDAGLIRPDAPTP